MIGFITFLHVLVCILLATIILMQAGRGGGLTESFSSAESMFGAQTNSFMIRATTVFATIFFITSLSLAVLSSQRSKSLMTSGAAQSAAKGAPSLPASAGRETVNQDAGEKPAQETAEPAVE